MKLKESFDPPCQQAGAETEAPHSLTGSIMTWYLRPLFTVYTRHIIDIRQKSKEPTSDHSVLECIRPAAGMRGAAPLPRRGNTPWHEVVTRAAPRTQVEETRGSYSSTRLDGGSNRVRPAFATMDTRARL